MTDKKNVINIEYTVSITHSFNVCYILLLTYWYIHSHGNLKQNLIIKTKVK